jgi:hypothetical protein
LGWISRNSGFDFYPQAAQIAQIQVAFSPAV